tara:strand:+ start:2839 stop:3150 length:312 start_codon:yes stop_codon:yes gene_type:complete
MNIQGSGIFQPKPDAAGHLDLGMILRIGLPPNAEPGPVHNLRLLVRLWPDLPTVATTPYWSLGCLASLAMLPMDRISKASSPGEMAIRSTVEAPASLTPKWQF